MFLQKYHISYGFIYFKEMNTVYWMYFSLPLVCFDYYLALLEHREKLLLLVTCRVVTATAWSPNEARANHVDFVVDIIVGHNSLLLMGSSTSANHD